MKRVHSSKTGALVSSSDGERSFWPSYADMMSAVALILFFIMLLSYIQNLITGNELKDTQDTLASTAAELTDTQSLLTNTLAEVDDAQAQLSIVSSQLEDANTTLSTQQTEIDSQKAQLTSQSAQLSSQSEQIASQEAQLSSQSEQIASQEALLNDQLDEIASQQALISEQEQYLSAANDELLEMRGQMQTIAVLRLTILEQIRDAIVDVMGNSATVSIGENGSLIISENILFDSGSSEIKPEAEPVLQRLASVFVSFLSDSENARYVDSIVISGHTDSDGSDESNRILSTDRANSVMNYMMTANNGELNTYASYFCSAGYGETRPVATNDTEAGRAANRRIEISITLKDDSILDIVNTYLEMDVPQA